MNILVLQPTNPKHMEARRADGASLAEVASALLARLPAANPGLALDIVCDSTPIEVSPHAPKYTRHATIRNHMLDTYLKDHHDTVLWVDSDLVDYPAEIPSLLIEANPDGIAAPLVFLDHYADRFYDIGGFVERNRSARMTPPWFEQEGPIIELDSVGCLYTAPAALYRQGLRYYPPPIPHWLTEGRMEFRVEHNSVMRTAQRIGYRIVCVMTVQATHAYLPEYGLPLN